MFENGSGVPGGEIPDLFGDDDPAGLVSDRPPEPAGGWTVGEPQQGMSVDAVIDELGRRGGPTEHGWHRREAQFLCPRQAYFDERAPVEGGDSKISLAVGSVLHEFLAEHYFCLAEDRPLDEARAKVERTFDLLRHHGHEKVGDEVRRLYYGYWTRYVEGVDDYVRGGTIVAVEKRLDRTLPWGEPYSVRADLVIRAPDGYLVVDHKTASRKDAEFYDGWALSPQMLGLQWAAARTYRPIVGFSINGIIKTKPAQYSRVFFAANPRIVKDWLSMLRYRALERDVAKLAGYPPNFAMCIRRYGKCHWFEECAQGMKPHAARAAARGGDR